MTIEIQPLSEGLGARVLGVDLSEPLDDTTFKQIHAAFLEHLVLVLPDQHDMTVEQHIAFSRRFGTLKTDLKAETTLQGHPEILVLSNMKQDDKNVGTLQRGDFWHIDLYFEKLPSVAGILNAKIVPDGEGPDMGDTVFANMVAAYEALPDDISEKVIGLTNKVSRVKSWPINYPHLPPLTREQVAAYVDVFHPLVRTHPETGRKSLFFGDISAGNVEGMPQAEGDALLRRLRDFSTQPQFTYHHRWKEDDVLIWDNRATIHSATDFDGEKYVRHMYRTTIVDDLAPV